MVKLQKDIDAIEAAGIRLVVVTYDSVETLKRNGNKLGVTFTLLSDDGSKTIDAYGIRNPAGTEGTRYDGIPYPGTYIVNKDGVVVDKIFYDGYVMRHAAQDLIASAEKNLP